jgi:DNA-binding transcriptional regulator YiaG
MNDVDELIRLAEQRAALPSGPELRALRRTGRLSTGEVSRALGVSRQTVLNWEAGKVRPNREHLRAYLTLIRALQKVTGSP